MHFLQLRYRWDSRWSLPLLVATWINSLEALHLDWDLVIFLLSLHFLSSSSPTASSTLYHQRSRNGQKSNNPCALFGSHSIRLRSMSQIWCQGACDGEKHENQSATTNPWELHSAVTVLESWHISASRLTCLRTGPNIFSKCWVFSCLRRATTSLWYMACVTQVSSASTQVHLDIQAKKVLTLVYKESAKVGLSSCLDSIPHHYHCQPSESVAHGHEIFLLVQYFVIVFHLWHLARWKFHFSKFCIQTSRHLGVVGQSNAQNWENIRLKRKEKNTTESIGHKEGKKKRALRQEASDTAVECVGDLFSSFSRACGLFVFPFSFPGNDLSWEWKLALMNVCCINFVVLLCLMNIKAEEITVIRNVINFTTIVAIKRVDIFSHHLHKGSVVIPHALFLQ